MALMGGMGAPAPYAGGIEPPMPPLIQPQAPTDPLAGGMGQAVDATAGIKSIAENFAAGFSKDPARRLQYQQQLQQEQAQRQVELQQLREHQTHYMDQMIQLASQGGYTPSIAQHVQDAAKPGGSMDKLFGDGTGATYLQMVQAADAAFKASPKSLTKLGPGEQLVDASGNPVASMPSNAQDPIGKAAQDLKAGLITQDEFNAIKAKETYIQPSPQTNVTIQAETEHAKNLDVMRKGLVDTLNTNAESAKKILQGVKRLNEAMASGFSPGAGADVMAKIGTAAERLGVDPSITESILHPTSTAQARQAVNQMVQGVIGKLGTGFSDADRNFTTDQLAKITDPRQAFVASIDYLTNRALGDIKVAHDAYAEYSKGGTGGDPFVPYQSYLNQIGAQAVSPVSAAAPAGDNQTQGQVDPKALTIADVDKLSPPQLQSLDITKITDTAVLQRILDKERSP